MKVSALQPASWRGVPFGVRHAQVRIGRRCAVHEYPERDIVWVEDLGRSARRIRLAGFLVESSAMTRQGDVLAQQRRLLAACEAPGEGELVHPALGRLTVSCIEAVTVQRWDQQRMVEIAFDFIESGKNAWPAEDPATGAAVSAAADAADAAAAGDFIARAGAALRHGAAVVDQAVSTAASWARQAQRLADDATSLTRRVHDLPGAFGRYFSGRRQGLNAVTQGIQQDAANVQKLMAAGSIARRNVARAADGLSHAVSKLSR